MRNITLSAEEDLIERAELRATQERTTLNAAFREWLTRYANRETGNEEFAQLMRRLGDVQSSGRISREEMNER
jgi:ribosomal protein L17